MRNEMAEEIIRKYLAGTASSEEEALLESWYIVASQSQPEMAGEPDYGKIEAEILESLRAEQHDFRKHDQSEANTTVRLWPHSAAAVAGGDNPA